MYIVFHGRADTHDHGVVKFDNLAKVEEQYGWLIARRLDSRTPEAIALRTDNGMWLIQIGEHFGERYRFFWMGNDTDVYAALSAIASGLHTAEECSAIARRALEED